jgi:putative MFS transporter
VPSNRFAYAGEYAPKRNRGRLLSGVYFIGGACSWPISTIFTLLFIHVIGWRGIYVVLGTGALIVFVLRFSLPESPRWLATHGRGDAALEILTRMGLHTAQGMALDELAPPTG